MLGSRWTALSAGNELKKRKDKKKKEKKKKKERRKKEEEKKEKKKKYTSESRSLWRDWELREGEWNYPRIFTRRIIVRCTAVA